MFKLIYKKNITIKVSDVWTLPAVQYIFVNVIETKARVYKYDRILIKTYVNGRLSGRGQGCAWTKGSISKTKPLLKLDGLCSFERDSFNQAVENYIENKMKQQTGTVIFFDKNRGEGVVKSHQTGMTLPIYGCNIVGAKTMYPETACMFLEKDQEIYFKYHSHCGAIDVSGGIFDKERWNSLDQSKLAFKKDENGKLINGLFS